MQGGDLRYHLRENGILSEASVRFYAAELLCAIADLHEKEVIYRDLKVRKDNHSGTMRTIPFHIVDIVDPYAWHLLFVNCLLILFFFLLSAREYLDGCRRSHSSLGLWSRLSIVR